MSSSPGGSPWFSLKVNSRPSVLYISSGERRTLVAAVLLDEDNVPHIAFSRRVERLAGDLVLSSPMIDENRPRVLAFKFMDTLVRATAWPIRYSSLSELHLFIDALHDLLESLLKTRIYVKVLEEPETLPGRSPGKKARPRPRREPGRAPGQASGGQVVKLVIEKQEETPEEDREE